MVGTLALCPPYAVEWRFGRKDLSSRPGTTKRSLPRHPRLLEPACEHRPITRGPKALQEIDEARIVADQNARLVLLDALDDAQCGCLRRGPGHRVKTLDRLHAARI